MREFAVGRHGVPDISREATCMECVRSLSRVSANHRIDEPSESGVADTIVQTSLAAKHCFLPNLARRLFYKMARKSL